MRAFGWVDFGLVMVVSLAGMADLPRGFSYLDQPHPVALVIAACCWAACSVAARVGRARNVRTWLLRPVSLRVVALVVVFAISSLAAWQTDRHNRELWKKELGTATSTTVSH